MMNIHEHQVYEVLRKYAIPTPKFGVATNIEEAKKVVADLSLEKAVVKVQVHAGGRGKAGGVKFAKTKDEIFQHAENLIGMKIVNNQTGPEGVVSHKIMIAPLTDIEHEYYVGAIVDRENAQAMIIASPEGGMEIEEIAEKMPEKILKEPIALNGKLKGFQLRKIAKFMGWSGPTAKEGMKVVAGLAQAFMESDASLLEINPLVQTKDGRIMAIDGKMGIDENALFRQKELLEFFDPTQISKNEVTANEFDLAYVALDGEIGCMVNGAGLAMATMDLIHHHGGTPANFLDVGGGASKEKVGAGFRIILNDENVKGILVNIFGGIMDCGVLAQGIVDVADNMDIPVPLVVRMEGTNVDEGKRILKESSLDIISADSLTEAAEKVVAGARG
jgi:succinyl-CoA synthetase beta subunit